MLYERRGILWSVAGQTKKGPSSQYLELLNLYNVTDRHFLPAAALKQVGFHRGVLAFSASCHRTRHKPIEALFMTLSLPVKGQLALNVGGVNTIRWIAERYVCLL